jgi:hypothetical protein
MGWEWTCLEDSVASILLYCAAAGEQVEDDEDDGDQEKEMNPCAEHMKSDKANQPEYEQNNGDGPKHCDFSCELPGDVFCRGGGKTDRGPPCDKLRITGKRLPRAIERQWFFGG